MLRSASLGEFICDHFCSAFTPSQTGFQTVLLENGAGVDDLKVGQSHDSAAVLYGLIVAPDTWISQVAVSDATFIPGAVMRFTSPSLGNLEGKLSLEDLGIQVSSGDCIISHCWLCLCTCAVMAHQHVRHLIASVKKL